MIHVIIGTKAQLIKMAPIMCRLKARGLEYRYISTGQHKETMSDILDNFGLPGPDIFLYRGRDISSIASMLFWSFRVLWISVFFKRRVFGKGGKRRDLVLVHGDTMSTLLGAIMARLAGMRVGHVESGLRSFDFFNPFPEEVTRVLTFKLAHYFFCQDQTAVDNLKKYKGLKVNTEGNSLYDALCLVNYNDINGSVENASFGIVTLHRHENINSKEAVERLLFLVEIVASLHRLIFVLHEPTKKALIKFDLMSRVEKHKNIKTVPRMDYFSFIRCLKKSDFVVSDGGSNQEECSYLGKPLLLLRSATERNEGLGDNCLLSGYSQEVVSRFSEEYFNYNREVMAEISSPSDKIVNFIFENEIY
jgi:UDP-N-acetylglucosamine 2-epimerase (non-hydrolysing)